MAGETAGAAARLTLRATRTALVVRRLFRDANHERTRAHKALREQLYQFGQALLAQEKAAR
jgi:hypothetical protein